MGQGPIPVVCPGCSAKLNAPDTAAGKKLKCPKCQSVIPIPAAREEPAFEVEEEPVQPAPQPPARPKAKAVAEVDADEEDEQPPKKPVKAVVEEEETRPKKKKRPARDEDEEDGRPRKKKKKGGADLARHIIGGVVLVLVLVVLVFLYWDKFGGKKEETTSNTPSGDSSADGSGPSRSGGPGPDNPGPNNPAPSELAKYSVIYSLAASGDGQKLASLGNLVGGPGENPGLRVWDLAGGTPSNPREFRTLRMSAVSPVALSPDGKTLATLVSESADKCTVTFWSVPAGNVVHRVNIPFSGTLPSSIAFNADGSALVVVAGGVIVTAGPANRRVTIKKAAEPLTGREVYVPGLDRVASVRDTADAMELVLWEPVSESPPTTTRLERVKNGPSKFAVSPNGKVVAVCSNNFAESERSQITLFELPGGKRIAQVPDDEDAKCRRFSKLTFSPDGQYLAAVGAGDGAPFNALLVYRVADAKQVVRRAGASTAKGHDFAEAPAFAADGKALYYVQSATKIARLDLETGKESVP